MNSHISSHWSRAMLIYLKVFNLCVLVFYFHIFLCTIYMPGVHRGQKASDTLELKLQVVVSAGSRTCVLWRSSQRSYPLSHLSVSHVHLLMHHQCGYNSTSWLYS